TFDFALPSAFGLTFLLFIGLGFFIRASVKDRTEHALYETNLDEVALMEALQQYFAGRAYRVTAIDADSGQIALEGTVGASIFMAVFLGSLAGAGLFCLALVLAIAFPPLGNGPYGLLLLAPLASWFYWRGATRVEQVTFRLLPLPIAATTGSRFTVAAHRDELAVLETQVPLKRIETE
ncbi:MAG TPA: cofactor assembly of complex C subunit B, partial [Candidatus Obscuribacterales bacterium]